MIPSPEPTVDIRPMFDRDPLPVRSVSSKIVEDKYPAIFIKSSRHITKPLFILLLPPSIYSALVAEAYIA